MYVQHMACDGINDDRADFIFEQIVMFSFTFPLYIDVSHLPLIISRYI